MSETRAFARKAWSLLEPVHAVTYFSPEAVTALKEAGYRRPWMGYFAGRSAPLGAVSAEVVHALFYNFSFERVAKEVPGAWQIAGPEVALAAREQGSVAALRRHLGEAATSEQVERAAELAARAAASAPLEGRTLFAANRALPEPTDPLAKLWHAATLLREHRGDGHIALLIAAGIGGRESHVLQTVANGTPREVYTMLREFDDAEWAACLASLTAKGLVADHALTAEGERVKAEIEDRTDDLAAEAFAVLSESERDELLTALRPVTRAVVDSGEIPSITPIGVDLRETANQG
ncbi:SCO6745 family protein [Nocardia farcinica]|uniref:SalK n=1 Tax=Nocardia farcinica TaxID=37329 RepID=A0A449GFM9_NOCFR|nr:hypothetical protein [Nocardia farcinica]MBF6519932.1 hypothetical protein [Nocardia farcinica]VFA91279.1 Uncharacterised protein [Nocardia farcinica]